MCCSTAEAEATAEAASLPPGAVADGQLCLPAANAATFFTLLVRPATGVLDAGCCMLPAHTGHQCGVQFGGCCPSCKQHTLLAAACMENCPPICSVHFHDASVC